MSETYQSVELLEPVEDVGGAAQPLLQVTGLTKHFPVRGDLFWGHGREAAAGAGAMNALGRYYLLLPNGMEGGVHGQLQLEHLLRFARCVRC